ncbi:MAG: SUMF1/EgtB/PvdO family nonheme iron enzyme [Rhodothermales bacterium]|nr:SUMF1/EgtB/PvdO family nonheme iron enzyme [Rhodothermales bacterium]
MRYVFALLIFATATAGCGGTASMQATDPGGGGILASGGEGNVTVPGGAPETALAAGTVEAVRLPGTPVDFNVVYVPGGEAMIGTPDASLRESDEPAPTPVQISPFWIAQTEVTFEEYAVFRYPEQDTDSTAAGLPFDVDAVARPSPPYEDPSGGMSRAGYPATGMTQWGALHYARWLSEKTGTFYRLPTEAEWEHACRLGGERDLARAAWYLDNSGEEFHPVGSAAPDALGLYDMLGNVSEWMLDEYRADYGAVLAEQPEDPWVQPTALHPRTVRGGAFDDPIELMRCGDRLESTMSWKRRDPQIPKSFWWNTDSPFLGFRLVRPVVQPTPDEAAAFWAIVLGDG